MKTIDSFWGDYRFLSNFHPAPFTFDGLLWPTTEHFFQACKTNDKKVQELVRMAPTPGKAKRLGGKVIMRADWDAVKGSVMFQAVRMKFEQNPHLKGMLLDTGDAQLIEGNNWHDNIWGECSCERCRNKKGQNMLGKILMEVRQSLL